MESAEHLARVLSLQTRGIQVLLWEHKTDLIRALAVLQAALPDFPDGRNLQISLRSLRVIRDFAIHRVGSI
jgi:hypothetical protein